MIADLPSWADVQFLQQMSGMLLLAAILFVLVLLFVIRSLGAKLIAFLLIAAAVFALVYR